MHHRFRIACFLARSDSEISGGGAVAAGESDTDDSPARPSAGQIGGRLRRLLAARENEHLEFKEARNNFHFEKVVKYCAALRN